MPLFVWSDEYSIDIEIIDKQHQNLFALINQLYDAMIKGETKEVMADILAELIKYTQTHFVNEEQLMRAKHYSGYTFHKSQHDDFIKKVGDFQHDFLAGRIGVDIEILNFLTGWLKNHILKQDKLLADL